MLCRLISLNSLTCKTELFKASSILLNSAIFHPKKRIIYSSSNSPGEFWRANRWANKSPDSFPSRSLPARQHRCSAALSCWSMKSLRKFRWNWCDRICGKSIAVTGGELSEIKLRLIACWRCDMIRESYMCVLCCWRERAELIAEEWNFIYDEANGGKEGKGVLVLGRHTTLTLVDWWRNEIEAK